MKIVVPVKSFSKNSTLVDELLHHFPDSKINYEAKVFDKNELIEYISGFDGLIAGLEKIDETLLKACPSLKLIAKYGVGLDNIDFSACDKYGVKVLYVKGVNKISVAELALGFMLSLNRNIYANCSELKNNIWNKSGGFDLSKKTVGIIGIGNIGKELIKFLKPFECEILVNDIIDQDDYYSSHGVEEVSKEVLLARSDVISIHTPLNKEMYHYFNRDRFNLMKKDSILINTARGAIIKTADLKFVLENNLIKGAALDVFEQEPPFDLGITHLPNLICTPHIGGNSIESILAMGKSAINLLLTNISR
jgi:phosphoglycerate dehydrogenase-like enzyme